MKRCRQCVQYSSMKQLIGRPDFWKQPHLCLTCKRFPQLRKTMLDRFVEKAKK